MRKRIVGFLAVLVAASCGGEEATAVPPMVPSPMPGPAASAPPLPPAAAPPDVPIPVKPVMSEAQKKFLAELEAALAARDAKRVANLYSTGAVLVSSGKEGVHEAVGRMDIEKGRERGFTVMGKAFPDVKWTHTRAMQKDDVMVVEWTGTGTDTGGFLEDKPTNKKVGWRGISILWFDDDGLVKREHNVLDPLTIMGQLGRGDTKAKVRPAQAPASGTTQWLTAKDTPEEKKNLDAVKALYPLLEKKDEKGFLAMLTDDVIHSDQAQPEDVKGKEAAKKELAVWFKAFPDLKIEVTNGWAFGDVVVVELETTGTFKGPLGPLKPNGKSATTHGIDVVELKDGKVSRMTSYVNQREFLVKYELMPKPAAAAASPGAPATAAPAPPVPAKK